MVDRYKQPMTSQRVKKWSLITTAILVVLGLLFTAFLVLYDVVQTRSQYTVDLNTPAMTVASLEKALEQESYIMLDSVFAENHYSSVFGEFFFGKNIKVSYGYSDDKTIKQKRVMTSMDVVEVKKGRLQYLTDEAAIGLLMIEDRESGNHLMNAAFLTQKQGDDWIIMKFYDIMMADSSILEVENFKLHYLTNELFIKLRRKELPANRESTMLYNFALSVRNITVRYDDRTLCTLGRDEIRAFKGEHEFMLKNDSLHNPDTLIIEGTCPFSDIVTRDPEQKYLFYITLETKNEDVLIYYYGDLLL
ncbi:MAG: hypothetical protein ACOC32_04890, partial [Nanoarchaeota archaeon]